MQKLPKGIFLVIFAFEFALLLSHTFATHPLAAPETHTLPAVEAVAPSPAVIVEAPVAIAAPQKIVMTIPETVSIPTVTAPAGAYLTIPSIGVNASIQNVGMTPEGAMAIPDSTVAVGWYSPGPRPGEIGSAVIGGHNRWHDTTAVFLRLEEVQIGDVISVVDAQGISTAFVVRETRLYNPTDDAAEIFTSADGTHLNLITCSGVLDPATNSYTKRFVVFTDLKETTLASAQ